MSSNAMHEIHQLFSTERGILINQHGGYYQRGKSYAVNKKMPVAATYLDAREKSIAVGPDKNIKISQVSHECGVGWHYVDKVRGEIVTLGRIRSPGEIYRERQGPTGPGSICMDAIDWFVLYRLYQREPTRSLKSYVIWLYFYTGTIVSKSTISSFFLRGFPIRGGLCKPNLVPYDKFRPGNIEKAQEYILILARLDPSRIKYRDEKSLKGKAIYNRKSRRDVVTGIIPAVIINTDLWNTYSIIGICGIDKKTRHQVPYH